MIQQNQIYSLEFQNFRRVHRNRAIGELFAVELEITEDEWHHLQSFPQDAIGVMAIKWTERLGEPEKPKREPKRPKEPTPYGKFWQAMDNAGFHNRPDVRRWIECASTDSEWEAKTRLRLALCVEKRSKQASPESVLEWMRRADYLDGAITFVENLAAETASR